MIIVERMADKTGILAIETIKRLMKSQFICFGLEKCAKHIGTLKLRIYKIGNRFHAVR